MGLARRLKSQGHHAAAARLENERVWALRKSEWRIVSMDLPKQVWRENLVSGRLGGIPDGNIEKRKDRSNSDWHISGASGCRRERQLFQHVRDDPRTIGPTGSIRQLDSNKEPITGRKA